MQAPTVTNYPTGVQEKRWYWTRTIVAGLWLVALAGLYFVLVLPIANAEPTPSNFRFPFSFITLIYAVDLAILGIDYVYKLARRPSIPPPQGHIGKLNIIGMALRFGFMTVVGGSYVTGAAVATPTVFQPVLTIFPFLGSNVVYVANYLHSLFALLIIILGVGIVAYELAKIGAHRGSFKTWLAKARYPEIKLFYWLFGIAVIVQGFLGLYLSASISPFGPYSLFGLFGSQSYSWEYLIRHIHGPLGALVFALFTNHIYFRIRPEFHIR
jgi:hypothetical protein